MHLNSVAFSLCYCRNVLDKCSTKFVWFCQVAIFAVLSHYKNFLEVRYVLLQLSGLNYAGDYFQQLVAADISITGHL